MITKACLIRRILVALNAIQASGIQTFDATEMYKRHNVFLYEPFILLHDGRRHDTQQTQAGNHTKKFISEVAIWENSENKH